VVSSDSIAVNEQDMVSLCDDDGIEPVDSISNVAAAVTFDNDPMIFFHGVDHMRYGKSQDMVDHRAKKRAAMADNSVNACAAINDNQALLPDYWVADTGSPVGLISAGNVLPGTTLYPLDSAKTFNTANGRTRANNLV